MHIDLRRDGIDRLSQFVCLLMDAGVRTRQAYREWCQVGANQTRMAEVFDYTRGSGMSVISALVNIDFHPVHPLVMFNYSPAAHNTLHAFPSGWTNALRMCRGVVFDFEGHLIAHPFPKFFNLGEHPESKLDELYALGPWMPTTKEDGHLGIIFWYADELIVTTRGTFMSPSARLATQMLHRYERQSKWRTLVVKGTTTLVEIIDPTTKVHVEYEGPGRFVLLAAYFNDTLEEMEDFILKRYAFSLDMRHAYESELIHTTQELDSLVRRMQDRSVRNAEGFVIRCANDTRVKIKYQTYIQLMVLAKLSAKYIMNRIVSGNLDRMLGTLDHEVTASAHEMLGRIMRVAFMTDLKAKRRHLYAMVTPEKCTPYYRGICNKLIRHLATHCTLAPKTSTPDLELDLEE